jgi:hypothetical protein
MNRLRQFRQGETVVIPKGVVIEVEALSQPENVQLVRVNKIDSRRTESKLQEYALPQT